MQVNIKSPRHKLTPETKEYIQAKMDMLDKYLGRIQVINCDIEIGQTAGNQQSGDIYLAEVNLELPGKLLRVSKSEKNLNKAIDKVKDHLARSIKRYKETVQTD